MNVIDDILIINTGGTFNKVYDEIKGELIIPKSSKNLKRLIKKAFRSTIKVKGIIYKDSLEFTKEDRKKLVKTIKQLAYKKVIVIHGTDTMDKSAKYVAKKIKNKSIIFTGAMVPVSIDETEAISNLAMALGFLNNNTNENIYISMHGKVKIYNKISKNRQLGIFE
jgi:L-asparaginase